MEAARGHLKPHFTYQYVPEQVEVAQITSVSRPNVMLTSILGGAWLQTRPPEIMSSSHSPSGSDSICLDCIFYLLFQDEGIIRIVGWSRLGSRRPRCREANHGLKHRPIRSRDTGAV